MLRSGRRLRNSGASVVREEPIIFVKQEGLIVPRRGMCTPVQHCCTHPVGRLLDIQSARVSKYRKAEHFMQIRQRLMILHIRTYTHAYIHSYIHLPDTAKGVFRVAGRAES